MSADYQIKYFEHGVAVIGPLPVGDLLALSKGWEERGFDQIDSHIAERLGASIAVTSKAGAEKWRADLGLSEDNEDWLLSGDTGMSSMTIYAVLNGKGKPKRMRDMSIPYDPDDFGRCYRLLKRYPHWIDRLGEVAAVCPAWKPFAEHWRELTDLWHEEGRIDDTGHAHASMPKLYKRMCELRKSA